MASYIYTIPLFAGALISCILVYLAWRKRGLASPLPFILVMLATAEWSATYALVISNATMATKIFWVKAGYVGASVIPLAWLSFTLQYSHRQKYLTRRNILLLSILPVVTILLAWTNEGHQLIWTSASMDANNQFVTFTFGPWLWIFVVYSYILLLTGTILLIQTLSGLLTPDGGQVITLLFGILVPWIGNLLYLSGLNPLTPLDPTPFTFILAGAAMYWGFHRFRLLSTLPLVQSTLFDSLPDGVLVLNAQDVVVALNPAAIKLLGKQGAGRPLHQLFPAAAHPLAEYREATSAQTVFSTGDGPEKRYYDWRLSTIHDHEGEVNGRIITLRDITTEQQAQERLKTLHQKTETQTEILRHRERYLQVLNDITQASISALNSSDFLQIVADKMGELIHADACHITLWDETTQRTLPAAASGVFKDTFHAIKVEPGERTMTQSVLSAGHAIPIEDAFNTPHISQRLAEQFPNVQSVLALPFIADNEKLGAALLLFNQPRQFAPDEVNRTEQAANQIALALAKIKFNDAMKRQIEELAIVNWIAAAGAKAKSIDELIEHTTQIVKQNFYPDYFGVFLLNETTGMLRSHHSYHRQVQIPSPPEVPLNKGIIGKVAATGKLLRINDVLQYPDYWQIIPETRSELCVPLRANDKIIGVVNTESYQDNAYTLQDEQFLTTVAGQLATAIVKIQLLSAEQSRRKEAETLREATAVLTSTLDLDRLLNLILQQLEKVILYDSATIFMFQGDYARIVACRGLANSNSAIGRVYPAQDDLLQEILHKKRPIFLENAQKHSSFQGWAGTNYTKGWLGVPLIVRDQTIGYLTIDSRQAGSYGPNEADAALAFANQAAIAIENARLYEGEQEQRKIAETLRAANEALSANLNLPTVLASLLEFLHRLVPYDSAMILRLKQNKEVVVEAHKGYEDWTDVTTIEDITFAVDQNWSFRTLFTTRKGLLIADTGQEPNWETRPETAYVKSWIGMPLIIGETVFGFFSVDKAEAGFFTQEHLRLTDTLTGQTAVAIQNALLYQDTQRRAEEMETINNVTAALRRVQTVDDVLTTVLEIAINVVGGIRGQGVLVDPETGDYVYRGSYPHDETYVGRHYQIEKGIMFQVINRGNVYTTEDLFADPLSRFLPAEVAFLAGVNGSIFLPLHAQTRIIGVMHIGVAEKRPFSPNEVQLLTTIAEIAGNALDRALLLETLEQRIAQRTHDLSLAYERLQELDRLKSKFISDVSHELRTPITNINLYLDLFEQGPSERKAYYMEILRKQTGRLTRLIEDTLSLSRVDMGRTKIEMEPIQLNEIITPVVLAHQPQAQSAGLTLTSSLQAGLPLIMGEPNQISQVITNLIANAINYTPSGKVEVSSYNAAAKARVCLEVKDTGMGIEPEDRKHLFERFYRGKNAAQSNIPGTGLGLAIVKEIIDLHEGQPEIESTPGEGTIFRIYFPYAIT